MLKLRNIRKNDTHISADYYPEGSAEQGFVSVDLASGEISESSPTSFDEGLSSYLYHAAKRLLTLAEDPELPQEATAMWY